MQEHAMNKKSHPHAETMRDGTPGTPKQTGGRPRSLEVDDAIMGATVRVLTEEGYGRMSVERIAAEAGVAKTSIYRRYRDRQDLAAAAVAQLAAHDAFEPPDTGHTRTDLLQSLAHVASVSGSDLVLSTLGMVMVEGQRDPALLDRFWERVFAPHRAATLAILERGVRRGEVRQGVALEVVGEALFGAFVARRLSGLAVTTEWMECVVAALWDGIGISQPGPA
jgi:AcrR family transcriptional regulator